MERFDSEVDSKLPAIEDWKLEGGKQKMRPHKDATQTPLPSSPDRQKNQTDNPKTATPANCRIHQQRRSQQQRRRQRHTNREHLRKEVTFVTKKYDGTLRITVKWKPTKYDELLEDTNLWNYEAAELVQVHYILGTATGAVIYRWKTAPGAAPAVPFIDLLTPDNLPEYLGLRTIPISSSKMLIFSFRIWLKAGPREWLKNSDTRQNVDHHHMDLSLSNASSDSGAITTAGFIFYKLPTLTHRLFYLKELRRKLVPPATPKGAGFKVSEVHVADSNAQDIPLQHTFVSGPQHTDVSAQELKRAVVHWNCAGKGYNQSNDAKLYKVGDIAAQSTVSCR
ncbi:hypothetical protein MHU86_20102 [Fragilaria crotonensis]|nr:hypothetical protein MHU86_20102 [Fragilaria crotonensis]